MLPPEIQQSFTALSSGEIAAENSAFELLIRSTDEPVDWAYDVWDDVVATLTHRSNRRRAIASQLLSNLAKSDHAGRILADFPILLNVTRDERFVTARHCLQSLWKVGAAGDQQMKLLLHGLEQRFEECASEKNATLIRYDIIESLRRLHSADPDPIVRAKAFELMDREVDAKYRKKYAALWRGV